MKLHPRVTKVTVDLVKRFEGLRRRAARLPDGGWTIGYGHTKSAREGAEVSETDAEALLYYDLSEVASRIEAWTFTPLNQNQFEALTAFAFNIGLENFRRSTVLKRVNEGQFLQAAAAMELWRKSEFDGEGLVVDALVRRRAAEKAHFLMPPDGYRPSPTQVVRPAFDQAVVEAAVLRHAPSAFAPPPARQPAPVVGASSDDVVPEPLPDAASPVSQAEAAAPVLAAQAAAPFKAFLPPPARHVDLTPARPSAPSTVEAPIVPEAPPALTLEPEVVETEAVPQVQAVAAEPDLGFSLFDRPAPTPYEGRRDEQLVSDVAAGVPDAAGAKPMSIVPPVLVHGAGFVGVTLFSAAIFCMLSGRMANVWELVLGLSGIVLMMAWLMWFLHQRAEKRFVERAGL